jgi:hypothetical protein
LIEIPAVPVSTEFSRWRPPNNRRHFVLWNTQRQRLLSQFNATFGDSFEVDPPDKNSIKRWHMPTLNGVEL